MEQDNEGARGKNTLPFYISIVLFAIGTVARIAPLFNAEGRLLKQFATEDGYLMLTIARNIAQGLGWSTAAGTLPTNGTQPLATVLYAIGYVVVGGDKEMGVLAALLFQLLFSLLTLPILYVFFRRIAHNTRYSGWIELPAIALWFASPLSVAHTSNCLETSLYVLVLYGAILAYSFMSQKADSGTRWISFAAVGVLLGLSFLARNDACLFILAFCLVHLVGGLRQRESLISRFLETLTMGSVSVLVATPWLYFGLSKFGHLMPISGQAESLDVSIGSNLPHLPAPLAEYFLSVVVIPKSVESHPVIIVVSLLITLIGAVLACYLVRRSHEKVRGSLTAILLAAGMMVVFYGLFFGADHFLSRYFYIFSPATFLLFSTVVYEISCRIGARRQHLIQSGILLGSAALVFAFNARIYMNGKTHMHFQVVEWVEKNVPDDVWVGAIQTGTLGYFHDRTINLDGKVNPEALEARKNKAIPQYVVDSEIQYLVDWKGIATWMKHEPFQGKFEVLVNDEKANLAVLKRL